MPSKKIIVSDICNLHDALKAYGKLADAAKMDFSTSGLSVSGKNSFARGELFTTTVHADTDMSFCLNNLSMFVKLLGTAISLNEEDPTDIELFYDSPFVRIESKKFKTKLSTCKPEVVADNVIDRIKSALSPVVGITTSSAPIKALNAHAFVLPDIKTARLYLSTEKGMENNTLYATIGNRMNDMNNSVTLELGKINYGSVEGRSMILDFEKLNLFNLFPNDPASFQLELLEKPFIMRKSRIPGKNDTYSEIMVICSFLVS